MGRKVRLEQREVTVGGLPATYRVAGAGEPVVLVHGLSGSTLWWNRTVPALVDRYRVYFVDLPGFGEMRRHGRGFDLARAAEGLREWMGAVGLEKTHLVGHSMGGCICIRLAARRPQAVDRLVLVDAPGVPMRRSVLAKLVSLVLEGLQVAPSFLTVILYDALRAGPLTLWRATRELLAQDVREDLRSIRAPTLIVWGEKDRLVPLSQARVLRELIPCSRLLVIEGTGHIPMVDRPREFNRALLAFLAGQPVGE